MITIETWTENKILRKVSKEISAAKIKKYVKIWKQMVKYIKDPDHWWVGLAAPQIWINKRIIVVSLLKDWEDETYPTIMMINPEIISHWDEQILCEEWCLSVPWETGKVLRYETIKLKFFDEKFKENIMLLSGLRANIVQHEIDHLDGILFTDKIENSQKNLLLA
jgi:peptide deformylase